MSITSAGDQLQYNYNGPGEPITNGLQQLQ